MDSEGVLLQGPWVSGGVGFRVEGSGLGCLGFLGSFGFLSF